MHCLHIFSTLLLFSTSLCMVFSIRFTLWTFCSIFSQENVRICCSVSNSVVQNYIMCCVRMNWRDEGQGEWNVHCIASCTILKVWNLAQSWAAELFRATPFLGGTKKQCCLCAVCACVQVQHLHIWSYCSLLVPTLHAIAGRWTPTYLAICLFHLGIYFVLYHFKKAVALQISRTFHPKQVNRNSLKFLIIRNNTHIKIFRDGVFSQLYPYFNNPLQIQASVCVHFAPM